MAASTPGSGEITQFTSQYDATIGIARTVLGLFEKLPDSQMIVDRDNTYEQTTRYTEQITLSGRILGVKVIELSPPLEDPGDDFAMSHGAIIVSDAMVDPFTDARCVYETLVQVSLTQVRHSSEVSNNELYVTTERALFNKDGDVISNPHRDLFAALRATHDLTENAQMVVSLLGEEDASLAELSAAAHAVDTAPRRLWKPNKTLHLA